MAISLEFRDNIQFVTVEGGISTAEESALRLKLDQKIAQGRNLLIVKLDSFQFENAESLAALQNMIQFFTNRGAWIGLSGLNKKNSNHVQSLYKPTCQGFSTEPEAKKWIIEESQKPKEAAKKPTEEDLKKIEIENLIKSYAPSFVEKDPDPFRIEKLRQEYLTTPSPDFLHALKSMLQDKDRLEIEIQKKEAELDQVEKTLLEFMNFRKLPATEAEILSHMKMADAKSSDTGKSLTEVSEQITLKENRLAEIKTQMDTHHKTWQTKIEGHQKDLAAMKAKNEAATQEMTKREKEETALLASLKQTPQS